VVVARWSDGSDVSGYFPGDGAEIVVPLSDLKAGAGSLGSLASRYLILGAEHILFGIDHLLFILGLLLLLHNFWKLIQTITAFTIAHSITLALDESLKALDLNEVLANPAIRRLVLKPGVQGGLRCTLALAESAAAAGKESVITTLVDSAIGVHATCQLAAAVDPFSPGLAHGLATSGWLREDIAKPPDIRAGYVFLSDSPGLGIHETF